MCIEVRTVLKNNSELCVFMFVYVCWNINVRTFVCYAPNDYLFQQPLMDNLDSQTYETFEKDPVKYMLYEKVFVLGNSNCTFIVFLGHNRSFERSLRNKRGHSYVSYVACLDMCRCVSDYVSHRVRVCP